MTVKEQWEQRRREWEAFNRWESENPPPARSSADIVADLGAIWNWIPDEVRRADPDPAKLGIQKLRAAIALLKTAS